MGALALALGHARVARAALHRHGQPHLADGRLQVAGHVHRQRLERRDVERVHARAVRPCRAAGELDQAGQEPRQRLAAAGRRDQERMAPSPSLRQHVELVRSRPPSPAVEPGLESRRQQVFI